jgi:phosphoglycerate dehydrogenase-like enzyme
MTSTTTDDGPPCILLSSAFGVETLLLLAKRFPQVRFELLPESGTVPEHAADATVLLRKAMPHDVLHTALDGAPGIDWIHTASAGFNWVLTPRVAATDIVLTRTANVLNVPIAEFVVALALALFKRLPTFLDQQSDRAWRRPESLTTMTGATASIIGAGAIGRATASRLQALGMRVLGMKRTPEPLPGFDEVLGPDGLDTLLEQADLLVLACPLTPETEHMIGREQFARMKSSAVIVNIARGAVMVEEDLIDALTTGVIAGAGLDVFATEPLPSDNRLWSLPNVIVTPHVSYLAGENEAAMLDEFGENLRLYLEGEPLLNALKSRELGY